MDITTRVSIKKVIEKNQELAKRLERGSADLETAIPQFAELAKVSPIFIRQNMALIRQWI